MGAEGFLLLHLKKKLYSRDYKYERYVFNEIMNNPKIIDELRKNIYLKDNILEDLENINKIEDKTSVEYKKLKDKVIAVGEYMNN